MNTPDHSSSLNVRGFTLPAILVVVGALLILAIGAMLIVGIERNTSRAFSDRERANLAARAGLEELKGIINLEAANDDFVVLQSTLANPINSGSEPAPQLFLARGRAQGAGYLYRWIPLFSTNKTPPETADLRPPQVEPLVEDATLGPVENQYIDFTTLPYIDKVRASWIPVKDEKNRTVGRYAYWIEDLQSQLDPATVGNEKGAAGVHARAAWPFPAAGLNPVDSSLGEPPLDQVALYAIDPAATTDSPGNLGKNLIKNRKVLISPNSLLAAADVIPPLTRLKAVEPNGKPGELADLRARAIEKGLTSGIRPYKEQPIIPFTAGIAPSVAGQPKLNLNRLVSPGGATAVDEMADLIRRALPGFDSRKGGLPASEDYIKTLAANAIDYADSNPNATVGAGYRGLDAYPLVSEFLMRFRWDGVVTERGRKFLVFKVATYAELWNMTNQIASGTAEMTHDTRYEFQIDVSPESYSLADMSGATSSPPLVQKEGSYWFPPIPVTLNPNEYRVLKFGDVTYKIDVASASAFILSPLQMEGEDYGNSGAGYKFKWNGATVDQARGGLHRNNSLLKFPANALGSGNPQAVRVTIPGHTCRESPQVYHYNMGDSRSAYYLSEPQDASAFPANYSPNRRNIRYQIYSGESVPGKLVYGRVIPSEWPDGGHNSTCESTAGLTQSNNQLEPDAVVFQLPATSVLRNPPADEAPMRLSSPTLNRYYSATELGRVFDPILWNVAQPAGANLPWGDVQTNTPSDSRYGGGNTLRIGRPDHPRFDQVGDLGKEAYRLLDLFHAGLSRSASAAEREGPVVEINGHVNLNTASRDALRAIAVGAITMDPKMAIRSSESHNITALMAPPVTAFKMSATEINTEANRIADAIILMRKTTPFASPSAIAEARDGVGPSSNLVFGNKNLITNGLKVHRTDSAAEEIFARVYEASTVRSRNFRVWIIGQAVAPTPSNTAPPEVLSEARKAFTVFADPGQRLPDGKIDPANSRITITNETDF